MGNKEEGKEEDGMEEGKEEKMETEETKKETKSENEEASDNEDDLGIVPGVPGGASTTSPAPLSTSEAADAHPARLVPRPRPRMPLGGARGRFARGTRSDTTSKSDGSQEEKMG